MAGTDLSAKAYIVSAKIVLIDEVTRVDFKVPHDEVASFRKRWTESKFGSD